MSQKSLIFNYHMLISTPSFRGAILRGCAQLIRDQGNGKARTCKEIFILNYNLMGSKLNNVFVN